MRWHAWIIAVLTGGTLAACRVKHQAAEAVTASVEVATDVAEHRTSVGSAWLSERGETVIESPVIEICDGTGGGTIIRGERLTKGSIRKEAHEVTTETECARSSDTSADTGISTETSTESASTPLWRYLAALATVLWIVWRLSRKNV